MAAFLGSYVKFQGRWRYVYFDFSHENAGEVWGAEGITVDDWVCWKQCGYWKYISNDLGKLHFGCLFFKLRIFLGHTVSAMRLAKVSPIPMGFVEFIQSMHPRHQDIGEFWCIKNMPIFRSRYSGSSIVAAWAFRSQDWDSSSKWAGKNWGAEDSCNSVLPKFLGRWKQPWRTFFCKKKRVIFITTLEIHFVLGGLFSMLLDKKSRCRLSQVLNLNCHVAASGTDACVPSWNGCWRRHGKS